MKKFKIDTNDKYRVLITELLPREVPIGISNDGFYSILKNGSCPQSLNRLKQLFNSPYGIPFEYHIRKSQHETRKLSLIHPLIQEEFVYFYERYANLIINQCSKSPISLRFPAGISKYYKTTNYFYRMDAAEFSQEFDENDEKSINETISQTDIKSYFSIEKFTLVERFLDSTEFQRLEQRFEHLIETDIKKFFL